MLALGYDNLVGGAVVYIGVATGFAAAMTNPFSVGIAQTIADVPLNSGVAYRAVIFAVFEMVSIWYVMRYARKVKQNPELSVLYGCDEVEQSDKKQYDKEVNFTFRRKFVYDFVFCYDRDPALRNEHAWMVYRLRYLHYF